MTAQAYLDEGLHQGQPVRQAGEPLASARAAMLMVHGRGARAEDILSLSNEFAVPGVAYLAPQAAGSAWYPNRFLEPLASNEPWLTSALAVLDQALAEFVQAGIPHERTLLLGFSQGACLSLEYAARHARRYGGVVGLSGALIGPVDTPRDYPGSLAGTPVFLGCGDVDTFIAKERVDEAAEVLRRLGGQVAEQIFPNMGHTIHPSEIETVRQMMLALTACG